MPYNLWDYTKKIPFGKQKGLFRCHFLVSHILKHLLDDDKESAALMAVLTLRCLHQVALDSGNWEVGWMLTTLKDPLSRRRWGGEPGHLETAADYLRAVQDLEKRTRQVAWGNWDQNQNETADTPEGDKVCKPPKGAGKGQRQGRQAIQPSLRTSSQNTAPAESSLEWTLKRAWYGKGAFLRFLRKLKALSAELGPRSQGTAPSFDFSLFPSPLPLPTTLGMHLGSTRNRKRRRGMRTAEEWVIVVWGLFNYFEVGCPISESSISAAARRCVSTCWTARHNDHAKNLFDDCWKLCRVKVPEGPNRDIAALLKQWELACARSYDRNNFLDIDSLLLHAGDVDPHRIAIPPTGAVIDPANHLQGERLSQFLSMAE